MCLLIVIYVNRWITISEVCSISNWCIRLLPNTQLFPFTDHLHTAWNLCKADALVQLQNIPQSNIIMTGYATHAKNEFWKIGSQNPPSLESYPQHDFEVVALFWPRDVLR